MVIASTDGVLLLGLSAANVERLQAGQPIRVTRASHGLSVPQGLTILIMAGDTEATIEAELRRIGAIQIGQTVINQRQEY